jgi:type IV secretion system protein VirB8
MAGNTAMVRFETVRRDGGGSAQPGQQWVAMIHYRYSGEPMRLEDRFVNPLGFQVTRYQRSAETLSPPEAPATSDDQPVTAVPSAAGPSPLEGALSRQRRAGQPQQPKTNNGTELTL